MNTIVMFSSTQVIHTQYKPHADTSTKYHMYIKIASTSYYYTYYNTSILFELQAPATYYNTCTVSQFFNALAEDVILDNTKHVMGNS